ASTERVRQQALRKSLTYVRSIRTTPPQTQSSARLASIGSPICWFSCRTRSAFEPSLPRHFPWPASSRFPTDGPVGFLVITTTISRHGTSQKRTCQVGLDL